MARYEIPRTIFVMRFLAIWPSGFWHLNFWIPRQHRGSPRKRFVIRRRVWSLPLSADGNTTKNQRK